MTYGNPYGCYMGYPGGGSHVLPETAKYNGKELTFEGIPTTGDEFITWKVLVEADVVRAANYQKPAAAQRYIALAFDPNATEAELRAVPDEMLQLDQLVGSRVMKGMKALTDAVKSGEVDGGNASFLMTKLNELQTGSMMNTAKPMVGRQWIHTIAVHFQQFAAVESKRAKDELSRARCTDKEEMGAYIANYDRLSMLFCGVTEAEKTDILINMF